MAFTYKDLPFNNKVPFIHDGLLAHRDAKFINAIYFASLDMLLQMDKAHLRRFLARAKLVSQWLEGILDLTTKLEGGGK